MSMEYPTIKAFVRGYSVWICLLAIMPLLLIIMDSGALALETLLIYALLIALIVLLSWLGVSLWQLRSPARIITLVFCIAFLIFGAFVVYAFTRPRVIMTLVPQVVHERTFGETLILALFWISMLLAAYGTYLFGFNKDVKALFKPADAQRVS